MGNTFTFGPKGDNSYNISTEKLQELYEHIRHVDESMCGFVKTLDSLRGVCELFLRQCDKRQDKLNESVDSNNGWETILTDEELVLNLLKTIEESVFDQKRPAIESLSKLLNYLIDAGTEMIGEPDNGDEVLSLDMYLSKEKKEEKAFENMTFTDGRIENLRKQLKLEKELNKTYKTDIEQLEKRAKHTQNEIHIEREKGLQMENSLSRVKEEYAQLEKEYESVHIKLQDVNSEGEKLYEMKKSLIPTETNTTSVPSKLLANKVIDIVDINTLKNERDTLKEEKEHLETALNSLKRKQYIHVQIIISNDVGALTSIDDLLARLKKQIESPTSMLYVIKLDVYKDLKNLKKDIPVLVICNATECRQYGATIILNKIGFKEKDKVALVAIHTVLRLSTLKCDCVKKDPTYKELGGVFNIAFDFYHKLHECDMNETNIQSLTDFVKTNGFRKSVLEVHNLLDQ